MMTQLVKALSERTSSKRPRQQRSFAHSVPKANSIPSSCASHRLPDLPTALTESGTDQVDEKLTSSEAKRTKRAMRAVRALQGLSSEESESEEGSTISPIQVRGLF